jgi:hypothetical protein
MKNLKEIKTVIRIIIVYIILNYNIFILINKNK